MIARAFVVPMLAVLTFASSAWADCAWVLWHINHHIPSDQSDSGLFVQAAYDSDKSCRAAAVSQADEIRARLATATNDSAKIERESTFAGAEIVRAWPGGSLPGSRFLWQCFPDSVDPRGPKG